MEKKLNKSRNKKKHFLVMTYFKIQDRQLYLDLKDLEVRCKQKWLTTTEQDSKWKELAEEDTYL
jgi:hypothetical protein